MKNLRRAGMRAPRFRANLTSLLFLFALAVSSLTAQPVYSTPEQCRASNGMVKKGLDTRNTMFMAIEKGELGSGIWFSWRAKMNRMGVKHAAARIEFRYLRSNLNLSLAELSFFKGYYPLTAEGRATWADEAERSSLRDSPLMPAFIDAAQLLQDLSVKPGSCGSLYINLLDDACLPVRSEIPDVNKCSM